MLSYTDGSKRPYDMWPLKFAGDVQITVIVRCQFYLWPYHKWEKKSYNVHAVQFFSKSVLFLNLKNTLTI